MVIRLRKKRENGLPNGLETRYYAHTSEVDYFQFGPYSSQEDAYTSVRAQLGYTQLLLSWLDAVCALHSDAFEIYQYSRRVD